MEQPFDSPNRVNRRAEKQPNNDNNNNNSNNNNHNINSSGGVGKGVDGEYRRPSATYQEAQRAIRASMKSEMAKRWIRIGSVFLYMLFVSITGVGLSVYYLLFWKPISPDHSGGDQPDEAHQQMILPTDNLLDNSNSH